MQQNFKSGFVTIVGRPNVGKSTLMNKIIGQKIAITSNKPQTTRNRIMTVYTNDEGQIVFLDTPGLHKAKNKLGNYMMNAANSSIKDADVVLFMIEANKPIGNAEKDIIEDLKKVSQPKILVINKVDAIKKEALIGVIEEASKLDKFDEIVPVSATEGTNCDELVKTIMKYLPFGEPFYDEDTITDQPVRQIAAEMIREKALHALNEEIPHGIAVMIETMDFSKKVVQIEATIVCEKESHKGIIIGKGGAMLKKIGTNARYEIEKMLEQQVNLKLFVKVKKEWRDSEFLLKNFGYNDKDFKLGK
ncbi:MAG: GTPase Era [Lachnospiraceae bacterium]|jgi:GTP-binding protein Era|nr:GTPase Era [Lachnospiraceae bacterium]